ncbi:MAG TPA: methyl-accepting chemotaxis protein [Burkholderiaceae bacterium]|nr:methyl-accepting chemotaxis protein [Burkholderiaceae bacterium]
MLKTSLASNMKIRTSIILVLVFYLIMLIAGAALGVLSLRAGNISLEYIVQNQRAGAALAQAIDGYRNVQASLGRAAGARVFGTASEVDAQLSEGHTHLETALQSVREFEREAANTESGAELAPRIAQQFSALINTAVQPMFSALAAGNDAEYERVRDSVMPALERDLLTSWNTLRQAQQRVIDDTYQGEVDQYNLVVKLVALGMLACFLIAFITYAFLKRMVLRPLGNAGSHFDRIASGDLTKRIQVESSNEIGVLYEAMRRMQQSLIHIVGTVRQGVEEINVGAREIYQGNTDLSARTEQQAAALQQTAASMEELSSTVIQNTDHATEADRVVKGAADVAQRGGNAVTAVVGTMNEISESSQRMAEIVGVIDGIAFQTNILALNAAVEAARAGEQGKGFAVVAGEVRSLAQRSAQAAREIKQLIDESLEKVSAGARQAGEAGEIMKDVVRSVETVTAIMGEIVTASQEQSKGINQVNAAVTDMDGVTQQNAALVQQAAAAAGSLQDQARRLTEVVAVFKLNNHEVIDITQAERVHAASGYLGAAGGGSLPGPESTAGALTRS